MNKRFLGVVAFALVVSAAASFLLYRLISARFATTAGPAQAQVIVAARVLNVGTLIKETDLRLADWNGPVPQHAVLKKEDVIERGVLSTIYEGEPVLESRLAQKGAGGGLAATIPVGMRAAALRVNEVVGVAGFVVPGQRVDVLIMGNPNTGRGGAGGTVSKTLLQNLEVLSAGQKIEKDAEGKPVLVQVVNLLVTPEQAEILNLASNETRIQLVLRNPLDTKEAKTKGAAYAQLFSGGAAPPPPVKAAPKPKPRVVRLVTDEKISIPFVVEVYHGGKGGSKKTETKFREEEKSEPRSEEK
jgi:pilus assembly protein CpaB